MKTIARNFNKLDLDVKLLIGGILFYLSLYVVIDVIETICYYIFLR